MRTALALLLLVGCDTATRDEAAPDGSVDAVLVDAVSADAVLVDAAADAQPADAVLDAALPLDAAPPDLGPDPAPALRLNHVQAKGTHNSYHLRPTPVLHPSHDYQHAPLAEQLGAQGVRQFELDVHARIDGGFDVLHLPFIDAETSCLALEDCLQHMLGWSNAHPGHLPVVVWFEPKDEGAGAASGYKPNDGTQLELEAAVRSVLPAHRIITPDEVRGDSATLCEAVLTRGWPSLHRLRGRFLFAILDEGSYRDAYVAGAPTLEGRLFFADAGDPQAAYAAVFKINNGGSDEARARVAEGFLVTSNVDSADGTPEENAASRAAALANGVQFLSSDHPAPDTPEDMDWLDIPGGTPARCNPVTAPEGCTAEALENLGL